jgi:RNA polymerase sigma factor (sigma-70 family)
MTTITPELNTNITNSFYATMYITLLPFFLKYGLENFQDALQEAFMEYLKTSNLKNVNGWFYTVVHNKLKRLSRKEAKQTNFIRQQQKGAKVPSYDPYSEDDLIEDAILTNLFNKFISELPAGQKDIIKGWLDGESSKEAAERLNISISSVRVQKSNARKYVKKRLMGYQEFRKRRV